MMKKNGFTLIELIITIGLMVLIGVLVANNLTSLFSRQEDISINDFKTEIEEAACVYIDLSDPTIKSKKAECKSRGCTITIGSLIQNGLLDENRINPMTKEKISGSDTVRISYPNGEKTCIYDME